MFLSSGLSLDCIVQEEGGSTEGPDGIEAMEETRTDEVREIQKTISVFTCHTFVKHTTRI